MRLRSHPGSWAILVAVLTAACLGAAPTVRASNTVRMGFFWKDRTLPYDARFAYRYDVAVYPDGGFADEGQHSFAYVTAQNKHLYWPPDGGGGCDPAVTRPYGVEVVIAYFGRNGSAGAQEFWLAGLDFSQFSSRWVAPDADYPNGWLGPHWKLRARATVTCRRGSG